MYCIALTHLHTHRYSYIHTLQKYSWVVYILTADMVLKMFYVGVFSFLEESKPVLCLKALGGVFKKTGWQEYMNYFSLHRVLFSCWSYPSLGVTSAVTPFPLFQSLNCGMRLQKRIVVLKKQKAQPAEGALQGLRQAVTPSVFPTGFQIKLNKRRSHAGQRLWHHVTCHAAFQLPPS